MLSKKLNPKKSKAQAMVEFAIALPVLLALLYGILETGRLVFLYSTIVNASRQAVRYAATTGTIDGTSSTVPHYQDCDGIRKVAKDLAYISSFGDSNISIYEDAGPTDPSGKTPYCPVGQATDTWAPTDNNHRITVKVSKLFTPIIPKLVPFAIRTITASSSRTIIVGVDIATPVPVQVATVTTITLDTPDPSDTGQSVSVTVTVAGGSTTPTGTVNITGADTNCTITLNSSGTGTCNVIFNSGGAKLLNATYNGDTTHAASSDPDGETHNVKYSTVTTITSISPEPSTSGQAVTVSFTVSGGPTTPTGTVSVTGANTTCNNITLTNGAGSCSVTFTSATTVTKTLTATYTPAVADTTHMASSGTADHDVILNLDTITRITSISPEPSVIGQAVTVSVKVVGLTTPTGTVNITGADTNCTVTLSGGVGSCTVNFASAGNKTLTATYVPAPAGSHNASSTTKAHAVNLQPTVTTIAADTPDPSEIGGTVSVTVTVTGGTATPTGTVTISGADANCVLTLTNGTGTCNVVFSSGGGKTLSATYSGDATHTVSNGTAPHTVNSISATPVASCNAITHGAITAVDNTLTMTVTNPYGFPLKTGAGTVTWNNDKGHQTGGDKTLSLQSIDINGTNVWTGSSSNVSTIPFVTPADIPAGPITVTITLTFDKTYDNFNGFENIFINLVTPGCESNPITSG